MSDPIDQCYSTEQLRQFAHGQITDEAQVGATADHLAICKNCQERFESIEELPFTDRLLSHVFNRITTSESIHDIEVDPDSWRESPPPQALLDHPKWEILRQLGQGGMGVVYLARNRFDRKNLQGEPVYRAIKLLQLSLAAGKTHADRFSKDNRVIQQLPRHPNIVEGHGTDPLDTFLMIIMEYVPGVNLEKHAAGQPLSRVPAESACGYILQALTGLAHLAKNQVLHRDIKPENLMLTDNGRIKILDFGLAKILSSNSAATNPTLGGIQGCGSPDYSSPEQIRDLKMADERSDLYSIGCTLYRLIAGHPPFGKHNGCLSLLDILQAHRDQRPPLLHRIVPGVALGLSRAVERLLEKNPDHRFQTHVEAAVALYEYSSENEKQRALPWIRETYPEFGKQTSVAHTRTSRWASVTAIAVGLFLIATFLVSRLGLLSNQGTIVFEVDQPDVEVLLDNQQVHFDRLSRRDQFSIKAVTGLHTIRILKPGFKAYDREVDIDALESLFLKVTLKPVGRDASFTKGTGVVSANTPEPIHQMTSRDGKGAWRIQGDELLQIDQNVSGAILLFGDPNWTDVDFQLEAALESGVDGIKIHFRAQNEANRCDFGIGSYGRAWHEATYFLNGTWGRDLSPVRSQELSEGKWQQITIRARGNRFSLNLNGTEVFNYEDDRFPSGMVGLQTWGTEARFRNLKVLNPAGEVLWEGLPVLPDDAISMTLTDSRLFEGKSPGDRREILPGIPFRWCPKGRFKLGREPHEIDAELSEGFWLEETEMTQAQWKAIMGTEPWMHFKREVEIGDDYAASWISHGSALDCAEQLTKQARSSKQIPERWKFALPTSAQWEYACRAGTKTFYFFGDDEKDLVDYSWFDENAANVGEKYPHRVAQKKANPWGFHDILGNVWEWCSDWEHRYLTGGLDPIGKPFGTDRQIRGGGWLYRAGDSHPYARLGYTTNGWNPHIGLRLAIVPISQHEGFRAGELRKISLATDVSMNQIWCPSGNFRMGSEPTEWAHRDDETPVDVTLTQGFWLGRTEVTQKQWFAVMGTKPWETHGPPDRVRSGDNFPATCLDYNEAMEFCDKLTRQHHATGQLPSNWRHMLPTEAQRQYACRAGTKTVFYFGDTEDRLGDYAWHLKNTLDVGEAYAHEVARKLPNPWGFYDMHGNTEEWCRDAYQPKLPGGQDPFVDLREDDPTRTFPGGGWFSHGIFCRSAFRSKNLPTFRMFYLGFRMATVRESI